MARGQCVPPAIAMRSDGCVNKKFGWVTSSSIELLHPSEGMLTLTHPSNRPSVWSPRDGLWPVMARLPYV
jgi:hypothetical protein